jgi:hypothetical protein
LRFLLNALDTIERIHQFLDYFFVVLLFSAEFVIRGQNFSVIVALDLLQLLLKLCLLLSRYFILEGTFFFQLFSVGVCTLMGPLVVGLNVLDEFVHLFEAGFIEQILFLFDVRAKSIFEIFERAVDLFVVQSWL